MSLNGFKKILAKHTHEYVTFKRLLVGLVVAISFLFCLLNHQDGHNWGGDFALYIHQAKSISEGSVRELLVENRFIIENTSARFSPILYPWGLPILLTPVYYTFGLDYRAFKVFETVLFAGALIMIFLTFMKNDKLDFLYNFLIISIIAWNIFYIRHTNYVLSEIPFLCFSFIGLYFILKLLDNSVRSVWKLPVLTGVILFFCFSIRTEGAGLFIALFAGQVQYLRLFRTKAKDKLFSFVLPYITAFGLHIVISKWLLPNGFMHHLSFTHWMGWETPLKNMHIYFNWLKMNMFWVPVFPYFIYIVLALTIIGLLSRLKKDLVVATYSAFLFVVLLLIWPYTNLRYLYALYPLILYFFAQGLYFFYERSKRNTLVRLAGIFVMGLCLSANMTITIKKTLSFIREDPSVMYGPETLESKEMFAYVKNNTRNDDIIAFFKPRVMHFYTSRLSLGLFSLEEVRDKADYYVENKRVGNYFQVPIKSTRLNSYPYLEEVFSNGGFNIYKVENK